MLIYKNPFFSFFIFVFFLKKRKFDNFPTNRDIDVGFALNERENTILLKYKQFRYF